MSGKISLSKLKKRSDASVSSFSFRFNPHDEGLEEISDVSESAADKDVTDDASFDSQKSGFQQFFSTSLQADKDSGTISSISTSSSSESQVSEGGLLPRDDGTEIGKLPDRKKPVERAKSATFPNSQSKTSETESPSSGTGTLEGRGSSDSSPMKESVKDYFMTKLSKRSASFDCSSQILESDAWSLISGIRGRIAKTWEERKNARDLSSGSLSNSSRCSDKKDFDQVSVDSFDMENSVNSSTSSENTAAALSDYTPEAEDACSVEILFSDSQAEHSNTASSFTTANQPKLSSDGSEAFMFTRRTRPTGRLPVSVTLSSLMAAKSLESDILEEDENQLQNSVQASNLQKEQTSSEQAKPATQETEPHAEPTSCSTSSEEVGKLTFVQRVYKVKGECELWWDVWKKQLQKLLEKKITVTCVAFLACAVAPLPSYFSGFLTGFFLAAIICSILWWLFRPTQHHAPMSADHLTPAAPSSTEQPTLEQNGDDIVIYKGWMNQLPYDYNPDTYHINMTHSIYVRLEGTSLRLSRPKVNIPKRAMWNEAHHELSFVHQRHFDISNAKVMLLPEGLPRKRLWSKKYPICITIPDAFGLGQQKIEIAKDCLSSLDSSPDTPTSSEDVSPVNGISDKIVLYLFARTDRDKEEWFRRFEAAAATQKKSEFLVQTQIQQQTASSFSSGRTAQGLPRSASVSSTASGSSTTLKEEKKIDFQSYMSVLLQSDGTNHKLQHASGKTGTLLEKQTSLRNVNTTTSTITTLRNVSSLASSPEEFVQSMTWLNVLIGRIFYDFLTQPMWSEVVANKIQKKLSKIKVPYFIEELTLKDINLGTMLPQVCKTYTPVMDDRGLWIDLDISYNGTFQMTLETKLNLMRLKKKQDTEMIDFQANDQDIEQPAPAVDRSHVFNSDEEDTAESSSDDNLNPSERENGEESNVSSNTGKRILRIVDKIAQSRYFQQAAEYKYIKKAMEEVSNMPIMLTVEVHYLVGRLVLNIPPPPTDRLWYGFRGNPNLTISVCPKLGEHVVTLTQVTDWIEKKLILEFQKLLVMPNMDDLPIPVMYSGLPRS